MVPFQVTLLSAMPPSFKNPVHIFDASVGVQEEKQGEDGGGAPEVGLAGGSSRFHGCITGTFSHTADSWNGSDLQPEI